MQKKHASLAILLVGSMLLSGCISGKPTPSPSAQQQTKQTPSNPELEEPVERALLALKAMNQASQAKDLAMAEKEFQAFRTDWAVIRAKLEPIDPKLATHIEDGAIELEVEFKKPPEQVRFFEFDEETVKIGRLIAEAAAALGVPVKSGLVQDPTVELPFNQEVRIPVTLVEHKIEPNVITVEQHTKVIFVITNKGQEDHEFAIDRYALEAEVKPGETKELELVTLDAGEFETACHFPGHYEVGMHGTLQVKPAELKQK